MPALAEGGDFPWKFRGRVTSRGAIELAKAGILPMVPLELIKDQSKSDMLAKLLVCLQAGWMIIQCIARVAQSLPLTLLEVHTVMHAIFAFFTYCLWLKKPHDAMFTTKVWVDEAKLNKIEDIELAHSGTEFEFYLTEPFVNKAIKRSPCRLSQTKQSPFSQSVMACLAFPIYGGIHLTVWKGHFPSNLERVFWIASALTIMGMPLLIDVGKLILKYAVDHHWIELFNARRGGDPLEEGLADVGRIVLYLIILYTLRGIGSACWVLARIYLLVESFASLRSLPLGSYNAVPWVSLIPHF